MTYENTNLEISESLNPDKMCHYIDSDSPGWTYFAE